MPVYVTHLRPHVPVRGKRANSYGSWAELIADTEQELQAFVSQLGLPFRRPTPGMSPRRMIGAEDHAKALQLGAKQVQLGEFLSVDRRYRAQRRDER